jgi:hypothetical protein
MANDVKGSTTGCIEKALQIDAVPSLDLEEIKHNGNIVSFEGEYYIFIDGKWIKLGKQPIAPGPKLSEAEIEDMEPEEMSSINGTHSRLFFYPLNIIKIVTVIFCGIALMYSLFIQSETVAATLAGGLLTYLSRGSSGSTTNNYQKNDK